MAERTLSAAPEERIVAAETARVNGRDLDAEDEQFYAFMDMLDPVVRAKAMALFLINQLKSAYPPEDWDALSAVFKGKAFIRNSAHILKRKGTKGFLEQMSHLPDMPPKEAYRFLTGKEYVAPKEAEEPEKLLSPDADRDVFTVPIDTSRS